MCGRVGCAVSRGVWAEAPYHAHLRFSISEKIMLRSHARSLPKPVFSETHDGSIDGCPKMTVLYIYLIFLSFCSMIFATHMHGTDKSFFKSKHIGAAGVHAVWALFHGNKMHQNVFSLIRTQHGFTMDSMATRCARREVYAGKSKQFHISVCTAYELLQFCPMGSCMGHVRACFKKLHM